MAWFKVDDKMHSWEEVLKIPRNLRAEAIGTWTLTGTWSADHLTDGRIPLHMIEELGGTIAGADALVAVKLWRKPRGHYQFVKWSKDQPTRNEVEARRAVERDRKADYRQRMAESRGETGIQSANVPAGQRPDPNPPIPSRPDPENNQDLTGHHQLRNGGTTVDNSGESVENANYIAALGDVAEMLSVMTNTKVDRLVAGVAVDHVLGKASRGRPVANPSKYVRKSIERNPHEWERFVHDGRLPEN